MVNCPVCGICFHSRPNFLNHASLHGWSVARAESDYARLVKSAGVLKLGTETLLHCPACRKWWEHTAIGEDLRCDRCGVVQTIS